MIVAMCIYIFFRININFICNQGIITTILPPIITKKDTISVMFKTTTKDTIQLIPNLNE